MEDYQGDIRTDDLYISTFEASELTGATVQWIRELVRLGIYQAEEANGFYGGGAAGESYRVYLPSLPIEAQIKHWLSRDHRTTQGADIAAYREKYGLEGMEKLLAKHQAVMEMKAVSRGCHDIKARKAEIALRMGVDVRTLYRWADAYDTVGLAGLMDKVEKSSKGEFRTLCSFSKDYATALICSRSKFKNRDVYRRLADYAAAKGASACSCCPYNGETEVREAVLADHKEDEYPLCTVAHKTGLIIPASRHGIDRFRASIPEGTQRIGRDGPKYWQANFMPKAQRAKPDMVNAVWFGDHHEFDMFVLDSEGHPVRPWLTAYADAASNCFPAWKITLNPNSDSIVNAFVEGVSYKKNSPFYGAPATLYIDNGKDYRSHKFEGSTFTTESLGQLPKNLEDFGLMKMLGIKVVHALPYRAWSKTIERLFGTLEDRWIRGLPGWCGNSPQNRPEDFSRELRRQMERGELLTLQEFISIFKDKILPSYHNTVPDDGIQSPMQIYSSLPKVSEEVPDWSFLTIAKSERELRIIGTQGIKHNKVIYWHDAMAGCIGQEAVVLYRKEDPSSITVMVDGRHLCEARMKDQMLLVGEDEEVIGNHMALQRRTQHDAVQPIKDARRSMEYAMANQGGEMVLKRKGSKVVPMEIRKAASAQEEVKQQIADEKDARKQSTHLREKFRAKGAAFIENAGCNAQ